MKFLLRAGLVLLVAGLGGCASHPPRHGGATRAGRHAETKGPVAPAGNGAVRDNIHLSQQQRYRLQHDREPDRLRADIAALPEPVPTVEPHSRYGNKSPYTVNGKTYRVRATARGYDERGYASWYGKKFDGYLTSSMERYDMFQFSAASKVLPLPSWARVTNLANGKSVIVRVNDRGPFVAGRIIDLSYAAAVRIGIWPKGTGMVRVQAIDPQDTRELRPPAVVGKAGTSASTWLQVGSFADQDNVQRLVRELRRRKLPVQVQPVTVRGRHLQRVRVGPLQSAGQVDQARSKMRAMGLPDPPVAVD